MRWPRSRTILVGCAIALVLGVEATLAAPHVVGAAAALARVSAGWTVLAVLAIAAALTAFALVRRSLLGAAGIRVSTASSLASVLVGNAFHVTLPGGIAFSTAYSYRWMRAQGAGGPVAGWSLAVNGLLSAAALAGLGLVTSLATGGPTSGVRLLVTVAGVAALATGVGLVVRHPDRAVAAVDRLAGRLDRFLGREPRTRSHALAGIVAQLRAIRPRPHAWTLSAAMALLNWVFDAACLAACALAVGAPGLTVGVLLVAFVAGQATSGLSALPGGLGVVDAALVLALVAGGVPAAPALSAVVLYRLISLVAVVAAGWAVHGWQRHLRSW